MGAARHVGVFCRAGRPRSRLRCRFLRRQKSRVHQVRGNPAVGRRDRAASSKYRTSGAACIAAAAAVIGSAPVPDKVFRRELAFRNLVLGRGDDFTPVRVVPAAFPALGARPVPGRAAGFRNAVRGGGQQAAHHGAEMARLVRAFRPRHHYLGDAQRASAAAGDHRGQAAPAGPGVALSRLRPSLDRRRQLSADRPRRESGRYPRQGIRRMGQHLLPLGSRIRAAPLRPDHHLDPVPGRSGQAVASGPLRTAAAAVENAIRGSLCHDVLETGRQHRNQLRRSPLRRASVTSPSVTSWDDDPSDRSAARKLVMSS